MSQTQTTHKSSFAEISDLPLVDTLARTDIHFWPNLVEQTPETFETTTLGKPEEWDKQLHVHFLDSRGRLHIKPIFSFSNSEETGLLFEDLEVRRGSSEHLSPRESREPEHITASTSLNNAHQIQVRSKIEALFNSYADGEFEDGMDKEFVEELGALIFGYNTKAVNAIADIVATNTANPEVVSEALCSLGQFRHPRSYRARLFLLERSLRSPSRWIRDGAALGLASMKDIHAVPYLREAIRNEQIPDLRKDLELVLDSLKQ